MDDGFGHAGDQRSARSPTRYAARSTASSPTSPGAVSREQAADGVEVPRHTAKFHLDRLVDEGLLVTEFRRLTGRTGPGAGRPAKLYRRSAREVSVSLPQPPLRPRRARCSPTPSSGSLDGTPMDVAGRREADTAAGTAPSRRPPDRRPGPRSCDQVADASSRRSATSPRVDGDLLLDNCPFDRLAADHPDLVCGMNLAFVDVGRRRARLHRRTPRAQTS